MAACFAEDTPESSRGGPARASGSALDGRGGAARFEALRGAAGPEERGFDFLTATAVRRQAGESTSSARTSRPRVRQSARRAAGRVGSWSSTCRAERGSSSRRSVGRGRASSRRRAAGRSRNAPRFAEHFIAALAGREADADQNGRVSVLEAFDYAARLTAEHYKRAGRLATEHALLEDSGDGVGHEKAEGGDGELARVVYFDSLTVEQAAANAEVGRLLRERTRYEEEIEQLKARKREMAEGQYESELERLFVGLAKTNRSIKRGGQ